MFFQKKYSTPQPSTQNPESQTLQLLGNRVADFVQAFRRTLSDEDLVRLKALEEERFQQSAWRPRDPVKITGKPPFSTFISVAFGAASRDP